MDMPTNTTGLLALTIKYWPGAAAAAALSLLGYNSLKENGYIDGVVHFSAFEQFRVRNDADHTNLKGDLTNLDQKIGDLKIDVREMRTREISKIEEQLKRIEEQTRKK